MAIKNFKMSKIRLLLLSTLFFLMFIGKAQDYPAKPNPPRLVNDFAKIFDETELRALESKLVNFSRETSNQISIVTVNDLDGMDKAQYATELAHEWGIGGKENSNGILILIKPRGAQGDRHAHIAVGYGLEAVIPDAIAHTIVQNELIPNFKRNDFYTGLDNATDILMSLAKSEYSFQDYQAKTYESQGIPLLAIIIILGSLLFAFIPTGINAYRYSRLNNVGMWAAFILLFSSGRGTSSGYYNHFSSGTGFFGGSSGGGGFGSGGGFGGFGGGGFGGGGAGGSW
jgi:uncharacterized protein